MNTVLTARILALALAVTALVAMGCGDIVIPEDPGAAAAQAPTGTQQAPTTTQPQSQPQPPSGQCGDVPFEGCCESPQKAIYCSDNGTIEAENCGAKGQVCAWDPVNTYYACGPKPTHDPTGSFPYECQAR